VIAADSNILVRLLTSDDATQAAKARSLFDTQADAGDGVWIADIVLVETVWTLARAYGHDRAGLTTALRALADNGTVVLESPDAVREATAMFESGPADFADCLLCAKAPLAGCSAVATFDRAMKNLPRVTLL
jgi:predicted nucleic-acid-binding protein